MVQYITITRQRSQQSLFMHCYSYALCESQIIDFVIALPYGALLDKKV